MDKSHFRIFLIILKNNFYILLYNLEFECDKYDNDKFKVKKIFPNKIEY